MTDLYALVCLNMVADIGSIRLNRLLGVFGSPQNILSASRDKLMQVSGLGPETAQRIVSFKEEDIARELDSAQALGLRVMTYQDSDYPQNLKNIIDPPIVLYVKGQITAQDNLSIAIVGSRRASFYGLTAAERLSGELGALGFTVISGLARGIDTYAHKGSLKAGGRTIAVIGSGFNHIYPEENLKLAEKISESGAVISEFSLNTLPLKHNFPRRNRVISGLSRGVLVVEAARNSGALITADFALEQGREVFALPGQLDSLSSFGTNNLIKQGAKLVTDIRDIIEEFGFAVESQTKTVKERLPELEVAVGDLSLQEHLLYGLINDRAVMLDDILQQSGIEVAQIYNALFKLQTKKLIRQLPGKQFIRS
jgi:DNA processing protein